MFGNLRGLLHRCTDCCPDRSSHRSSICHADSATLSSAICVTHRESDVRTYGWTHVIAVCGAIVGANSHSERLAIGVADSNAVISTICNPNCRAFRIADSVAYV